MAKEVCGLKVGGVIYDPSNPESVKGFSEEEVYVMHYLMNYITESGDPNDSDLPNALYVEGECINMNEGKEGYCDPQALHDACVKLQAQGIGDEIYWPAQPEQKFRM